MQASHRTTTKRRRSNRTTKRDTNGIGARVYAVRTANQRRAAPKDRHLWSRREVARRVGMNKGNLWRLETVQVRRPKYIKEIAKVLGVSAYYLITGKAPRHNLEYKLADLNERNLALVATLVDNLLAEQEGREVV